MIGSRRAASARHGGRLDALILVLGLGVALGWAMLPAVLAHVARMEPLLWQRVPMPAAVQTGAAYRVDLDAGGWSPNLLVVLEDGEPLTPDQRNRVREEGGGTYRVLADRILFAPSDNSDPRNNGRVYEVLRPRELRAWQTRLLLWLFVALQGALALLVAVRLRHGIVRALPYAVTAMSVAALSQYALLRWLPETSVELMGEKLLQLDRSPDTDTLFLGSSRVHRHLDPISFDRESATLGRPTCSYNLGAPGMRMLEALYLARTVLEEHPQIRRLLVEAEPSPLLEEERNWGTPRVVRWHDLRSLVRLWPAVIDDSRRTAEAALRLARRSRQFALRTSLLGKGVWLIESWASPPGRFVEPERRGFLPADDNLADPHDEAQELHLSRMHDMLHSDEADWQRRIARLRRTPKEGSLEDAFELSLFAELQELADARGIELVFVLSPRPHRLPNLVHAYESGAIRRLIRFDDPDRFPSLYEIDHRFDVHHLDREGAIEMTRLLAQRLVEGAPVERYTATDCTTRP